MSNPQSQCQPDCNGFAKQISQEIIDPIYFGMY